MNKPYYVLNGYGETCGHFAVREEAIAKAKLYHSESKYGTNYFVEYREEIFSTKAEHDAKSE